MCTPFNSITNVAFINGGYGKDKHDSQLIGATMSRKGETPTDLMCRVDELLHTSKSSGRNCVSMDD